MFVRKVKKNQDHVSIRIVKSVRKGSKVKQQTICCVGHTHKNNIAKIQLFTKIGEELIQKRGAEIQEVFPSWESQKQQDVRLPEGLGNKHTLPDDLVYARSLQEQSRVAIGIRDIFGSVYEQLNIKSCLSSGYKKEEVYYLLKKMVLGRLECPISKRKTVKDINKTGKDEKNKKDEDLKLDRVYRMMDKLYTCRERIKNRIFNQTLSFLKQTVDVILSKNTKIVFGFLSQSMKSLPELLWPVKNYPVPVNSLTAQFNKNPKLVITGACDENEIDIRDWFGGSQSFQVKEEVQGLGSYGKTLTVLSCSEDLEEIYNNEEEMLLDKWTPKF